MQGFDYAAQNQRMADQVALDAELGTEGVEEAMRGERPVRLAELVSLPTVITAPGRYRTRAGEIVTIDRVGRPEHLSFADVDPRAGLADGHYPNGVTEVWDVSGRLLPFSQSDNDIIHRFRASIGAVGFAKHGEYPQTVMEKHRGDPPRYGLRRLDFCGQPRENLLQMALDGQALPEGIELVSDPAIKITRDDVDWRTSRLRPTNPNLRPVYTAVLTDGAEYTEAKEFATEEEIEEADRHAMATTDNTWFWVHISTHYVEKEG